MLDQLPDIDYSELLIDLATDGLGFVVSALVIAPITSYFVTRSEFRKRVREKVKIIAYVIGQSERLDDAIAPYTTFQRNIMPFAGRSRLLDFLQVTDAECISSPQDIADLLSKNSEQKIAQFIEEARAQSKEAEKLNSDTEHAIAEFREHVMALERTSKLFSGVMEFWLAERVASLLNAFSAILDEWLSLQIIAKHKIHLLNQDKVDLVELYLASAVEGGSTVNKSLKEVLIAIADLSQFALRHRKHIRYQAFDRDTYKRYVKLGKDAQTAKKNPATKRN